MTNVTDKIRLRRAREREALLSEARAQRLSWSVKVADHKWERYLFQDYEIVISGGGECLIRDEATSTIVRVLPRGAWSEIELQVWVPREKLGPNDKARYIPNVEGAWREFLFGDEK